MKLEPINVTMYCPICGNDQFSTLDNDFEDLSDAPDETRLKCSDCNCIITKEELLESNQDIITAHIDDIQEEFIKDLRKELKKVFKKR